MQLFIVLFYILFEGQNSCGQEVISLDTILRLRELMNSRGWSEYRLAKESKLAVIFLKNGGPNRDRTDDLTDANRTLSQLSYRPIFSYLI